MFTKHNVMIPCHLQSTLDNAMPYDPHRITSEIGYNFFPVDQLHMLFFRDF